MWDVCTMYEQGRCAQIVKEMTNEELWARTGQEDVETTIKRRKWKWIGHTLRKAPKKQHHTYGHGVEPPGKK